MEENLLLPGFVTVSFQRQTATEVPKECRTDMLVEVAAVAVFQTPAMKQ